MKQQLINKIESARTPDFGNILSKSFDLFKVVWMDSFMHVIVTFLVAIPLLVLVYIPFVPALIKSARDGETVQLEPYLDYPLLTMFAYGVMVFVLIVVILRLRGQVTNASSLDTDSI